jgi:hypothetical protein
LAHAREPQKLTVVLGAEHKAALTTAYAAGLRASEELLPSANH